MSEKALEKDTTKEKTPEIKLEVEDPPAELSSPVQGAEGGSDTNPQANLKDTGKKGKVTTVTKIFKRMTPPSKSGPVKEKKSPSVKGDERKSAETSKGVSPQKEDEAPRRSERLREGASGTSDIASSLKYVKDKIASVGKSKKKRDAEKDNLCAPEGGASPRKQPKRSTKSEKSKKKKRVQSPSGFIRNDDPRKLKDSNSVESLPTESTRMPEASKDDKSSSISDLSFDADECSNDDESSSASEQSSDQDKERN